MRSIQNWLGLKCKLKMCGCLPKSDAEGLWCECVTCGKKVAYVSRIVMRSYMNLQDAIKAHRELSKD